MNRKQIQSFIDRFSEGQQVGFLSESELSKSKYKKLFLAKHKNTMASILILNDESNIKAIIFLKNDIINHDFILRAAILHELGHLANYKHHKNNSDYEALAHMWAIKKAIKYHMAKILAVLIMMWADWKEVSWKNDRLYRLAYKQIKSRFRFPDKLERIIKKK